MEDIAATVAFLCSPGGSFINGQTIVVDGGWSSTKYLSEFASLLAVGRPLNLFATLDQAAARFGDRGAVYLGQRRLYTWDQLRDRALRLAGSLRAAHATGTRIAVAAENRPELVELFYAVWAAECVLVPINFKLHPREMVQILTDSGAATVFASPKIARHLAPIAPAPVDIIGGPDYETRFAATPAPSPSPTRPPWRGCSTPAAPPGAPRAPCSPTAI